METLILYCEEMKQKYPHHKEEIVDYLQLAIDEIEQGASEPNEINLCIGAIEGLIQNDFPNVPRDFIE